MKTKLNDCPFCPDSIDTGATKNDLHFSGTQFSSIIVYNLFNQLCVETFLHSWVLKKGCLSFCVTEKVSSK